MLEALTGFSHPHLFTAEAPIPCNEIELEFKHCRRKRWSTGVIYSFSGGVKVR